MQITYIVEPIAGNGYLAKTGEPLFLRAEGATKDEAVRKLKELFDERLRNGAEVAALGVPASNPWVEFDGMFKDDPYFDEWQQAIAENRRKADQDVNSL